MKGTCSASVDLLRKKRHDDSVKYKTKKIKLFQV